MRQRRQRLDLAAGPDEAHLVAVDVEADVGARDVVGDDQVAALARELAPRAFASRSSVSAAKPTTMRRPLSPTDLGEDVGVAHQLEREPRAVGAVLACLILRGLGRRGPVVGHRRRQDRDVARGSAREHGVAHLERALDVDAPHAGRRRERDGPGDEHDLGAAPRRLLGDREAHLARRAVAR